MTYYDVLGVSKSASFNEINLAFISRVYKVSNLEAYTVEDYKKVQEARMLLSKAYETLSNSDDRLEYDKSLKSRKGTVSDFLTKNYGKSFLMFLGLICLLGSLIDFFNDLDPKTSFFTASISFVFLLVGFFKMRRNYENENNC